MGSDDGIELAIGDWLGSSEAPSSPSNFGCMPQSSYEPLARSFKVITVGADFDAACGKYDEFQFVLLIFLLFLYPALLQSE